jgi:hypothetical protein
VIALLKSMIATIEPWPGEEQAMLFEAARMIVVARRGKYQANDDELRRINLLCCLHKGEQVCPDTF